MRVIGADIYLRSVYEPNQKKHERNFYKWVNKRDGLPHDSADAKKAQEKVTHYYDLMYAQGYFRDSYNGGSLFGFLGLSWWSLADELCDQDGNLPIDAAKIVLDRLRNSSVEACFPEWEAAKRNNGWTFEGEDNAEAWKQHFRDKKDRLEALLEQSIALNEPLHWSV